MRILLQPSLLIISTVSVVFFLQSQPVRADVNDDYYQQLRKLKKYDPAAMEKIKRDTIDAEQIRKVNALSKANFAHNAEVEAKSKKLKEPKYSDKEENKAPATGPNGEKAGPPRMVGKSKKKPSGASETPLPEKKEAVTKKSAKPAPSIKSSSPSAPIKVDHDTPDELNFPGEDGKEDSDE